jgi:hypothetical protein
VLNNLLGNDFTGILVALGNGNGSFQPPSLYSSTIQDYYFFENPYTAAVQTADINGVGIPDLVYTNQNFSTVGVLFGNGDGTFGLPNEYPSGGAAPLLLPLPM